MTEGRQVRNEICLGIMTKLIKNSFGITHKKEISPEILFGYNVLLVIRTQVWKIPEYFPTD